MATLNEIKNWDNLSESTKQDIEKAFAHKLDSIGEFYFNPDEKPISSLIQFAQSLSFEPGTAYSVDEWKKYTDNRYGFAMQNIKPYDVNGGLTSYALCPNQLTAKKLIFPQTLNYVPGTLICNKNQTSTRTDKILNLIRDNFNFKVEVIPTLIKMREPYEVVKAKGLFNKQPSTTIKIYNDGSLNDFTIISIACYALINQLVEQSQLTSNVKCSVEKLATLGLIRALDLNNPEISFKLDEALKLDFFTTLGLLNGERHDVALQIKNETKEFLDNVVFAKLGLSKEKALENMKNMGFEFDNENQKSISDVVFGANNLKKVFGFNSEMLKASQAVTHAVIGAGINISRLKRRIRNDLPGYIQNSLLSKNQLEEFYDQKDGNIIKFVLEKNPRKYSKFSVSYLSQISDAFAKMVSEMVNKTTNFAEENVDNLESTNPKTLLKLALNKDSNSKSEKPLSNKKIIKNEFKEVVKEVVKANKPQKKQKKLDQEQTL